ncbi:MAG: protein adenylyltransferase SelO [Acidimicrobiales bacterium]
MDSDHTTGGESLAGTERDRAEVAAAGLDRLQWDNRFVDRLPVDPSTLNRPRQVSRAVASRVQPLMAPAPGLVAWSAEVAEMVGIPATAWTDHESLMARMMSGSLLLPGMDPHAACYGGHQFGHWAGQLGDGRAISLGEVIGADGRRHTLQLKGAGPTPYSRSADGLAVLRSSVREFLCSEAMFHLGIATTRALSLVVTGDKVVRDILYDGNPRPEPGAVVCRVAPSFIRFGNFQIFAARQEIDELRQLTDFTIENYFPHLLEANEPGHDDLYGAFFAEVCETTLAMVIGWMGVGFVHGVMNTDNMSIHGATIDYGPYGWLEGFDPGWTPNTTDAANRRYRYGHQPQVAQWNLLQLANALVQLTGDPAPLEAALQRYAEHYERDSAAMWRSKAGLVDTGADDRADELVSELLGLLTRTETDMTIFFRRLATIDRARFEHPDELARVDDGDLVAPLADAYYLDDAAEEQTPETAAWLRRYLALAERVPVGDHLRRRDMNLVNPNYVLRNYLAQVAIDAAEQNDFGPVVELLDVMRTPYDEIEGRESFALKRPEWARERPGCSQLSCSS